MARGKRNFIPGSKKEKISLFHIFSKGYFQTVELTKKLVTALMLSSIVIIFSGLSGVYLYTRRVNTPFVVLVDRESGDVINSKVLEKPKETNSSSKKPFGKKRVEDNSSSSAKPRGNNNKFASKKSETSATSKNRRTNSGFKNN